MGSKQSKLLWSVGTATLVLVLLQTGCIWRRLKGPDLAEIYDQAAQHQHVDRNPIIVIPGIMGSNLADDGIPEPSSRTVTGCVQPYPIHRAAHKPRP